MSLINRGKCVKRTQNCTAVWRMLAALSEIGQAKQLFQLECPFYFTNKCGAAMEDNTQFTKYIKKCGQGQDLLLEVIISSEGNSNREDIELGSPENTGVCSTGSLKNNSDDHVMDTDDHDMDTDDPEMYFPENFKNCEDASTPVFSDAGSDGCNIFLGENISNTKNHSSESCEISEISDLEDIDPITSENAGKIHLSTGSFTHPDTSIQANSEVEAGTSILASTSENRIDPASTPAGNQEARVSFLELKEYIFGKLKHQIKLEEPLDTLGQRQVVNEATNFMIARFGQYPQASTKRSCAEILAEIFPILNVDALYDKVSHTGRLDYTLRYRTKKYIKRGGTGKYTRKRKAEECIIVPGPSKKQSVSLSASMEVSEKVQKNLEFLKHAVVSQRTQIIQVFKENYDHRQETWQYVMENYGKIMQILPELVILDFETRFGTVESATQVWKSLKITEQFEKLEKNVKKKVTPLIEEWNYDVVRALKLLALLPPTNSDGSGKKGNVVTSVTDFLMFFQEGKPPKEIRDYVNSKTDRIQMFAMGSNKKAVSNYYAKIDQRIFLLSSNYFEALDWVFKCHYVFHIHFKPDHNHFFIFMAKYFYKMSEETVKSHKIKQLAHELNLS
ncbi:hypothetical protein DMENIID0001_057650 [Sergentomyia squamirostris]